MKPKKGYIQWGLVLLGVVVASIILLMVLLNFQSFMGVLGELFDAFSPITYGAVFAFLLNPICNKSERFLLRILPKREMSEKSRNRIGRIFGVFVSLVVAALIVYATVSLILPQLIDTISSLVSNFPVYYQNAEEWLLRILENNPTVKSYANDVLERLYTHFSDFLTAGLLDNVQSVLLKVTSSVYSVIKEVLNMVIGVVVSVYILLSKEKFLGQAKKIVVANFTEERANYLMEIFRQIHRIFNGFVIGKLIDSAIIGVICYVGMVILRMPYRMLIAVIIGITNVIPFFGPFIGAVPTSLLVLLVSPIQCLYFIIFIFALQQLDGNVIGPRILGDTVGISGFWVLVSITVASGLFGFAGMILGVPIFAVIYMLIGDNLRRKLQKKGKSIQTEDYIGIRMVADLEATSAPMAEDES